MQDYKQVDIYVYDPVTKEFLAKGVSDRNPLDPDTPIIPGYSTTIIPPDKKDGYTIVWVGNKWEYKEDHRGETWFNATTEKLEEIEFIGELNNCYYSPDSVRANKPEGDYWKYDSETDTWIGDSGLYKLYVNSMADTCWDIKQNSPFEFEGFRYIASWRDLYTSIWVTLKDGIKEQYRLQDYDGKFNIVTKETMKPIIVKMSDINDEMYTDKHNLQLFFIQNDDFNKLQKAFETFITKEYK